MKTFLLTATYLVGIGELILAVFFWVTHSKSEIRKVMALLAFSTGMWVIFSGLHAYQEPNSDIIILTSGFVNFFGGLLLTTLVFFSIIFPLPLYKLDELHKILLYIPLTIFSYLIFFTRTIIAGYNSAPINAHSIQQGVLFDFYYIFLILLFCLGISILIFQIRRSDGINKQNATTVLFSIILGGLPAVVIDLFLVPFFPGLEPNYLIGVASSFIWLFITAHIVLKK